MANFKCNPCTGKTTARYLHQSAQTQRSRDLFSVHNNDLTTPAYSTIQKELGKPCILHLELAKFFSDENKVKEGPHNSKSVKDPGCIHPLYKLRYKKSLAATVNPSLHSANHALACFAFYPLRSRQQLSEKRLHRFNLAR